MGIFLFMPNSEVPMLLDPVPPSLNPPENDTTYETVILGSMILNATGNVTGMIPHNGPFTFYLNLQIIVTNNGTEDVTDFHVIKSSLYHLDNELFYTFGLTPYTNQTILAGQTVTLNYQNNVTSLDVSGPMASKYARILVSFNTNQECILTTPILEGVFAIE